MRPRVAIVFPGQGSQIVGMGKGLAEQYPEINKLFDTAAAVVGRDLLEIMYSGPEGRLQETRISQPAIFTVNVALAQALGSALKPICGAGHSFGEYCALTLAGAMSFEQALRLVHQRGLAMGKAADASPGTMAAVLGLEAAQLRLIVEEIRAEQHYRVRLANFNAPTQIVISGDRRGVERVGERALAAGAKRVVPLNVSGAWHSELMAPASVEFAPFVEQTEMHLPQFPVISNVDALEYHDVATIRDHLIRSVTDEVRWHETALAVLALQPDIVIEFGASRVLAPLIKRLPNSPEAIHVGDAAGIESARVLLEGS